MNILHLKYAVEVAKAGSISKAAENLLMGQPNLSRAIKELEQTLGITIFARSAKGMTITPDGEEFLSYAKSILKQVEDVENLYKGERSEPQKFSISVPRASYISAAFSAFTQNISDAPTEIFYKETNSLRAVNNIINKDYRLGIIRYAQNHDKYFREMLDEKGMVYETISQFTYVLLMHKSCPLAAKDDISFDELTNYIEIAHGDPYVPTLSLAQVKKEELPDNIKRRIYVYERASQFEILEKNKNTFMWVSPASESLLNKYGLVQKVCPDNKKVYKDVLIYRKDYELTQLDKDFINELISTKRKYL